MAFVYKIEHVATGRCYVGHTSRFPAKARYDGHVYDLQRNQHRNARLQNGWNSYGASAFVFVILERCAEAKKLEREQYHIDTQNSYYNIAKVAGSRLGVPQPDSLRLAMRGNQRSTGTRSKKTRRRIARVQRNRWWQPMLGKHHSEETKAEIRASNKANTTRAHVGMTGKKHSKATKLNMRQAKLGHKQSPETVAKRFAWREAA